MVAGKKTSMSVISLKWLILTHLAASNTFKEFDFKYYNNNFSEKPTVWLHGKLSLYLCCYWVQIIVDIHRSWKIWVSSNALALAADSWQLLCQMGGMRRRAGMSVWAHPSCGLLFGYIITQPPPIIIMLIDSTNIQQQHMED